MPARFKLSTPAPVVPLLSFLVLGATLMLAATVPASAQQALTPREAAELRAREAQERSRREQKAREAAQANAEEERARREASERRVRELEDQLRRLAAAAAPAPPAAQLPLLDGQSAAQMQALQAAAAQAVGRSVVFTDALKGGGQGPQMVVVPAGRYKMGAGEEERKRYVTDVGEQEWADWEKPAQVTVARAFALGKHEVTRGEYAVFVKATGHKAEGGCWYWGAEFKQDAARNWQTLVVFEQADNHPAVCVSWEDAQAYAKWLSGQTGQRYRLASEAEWELGARAGTTTRRYWGEDWDNRQGCEYANVADKDLADKLNEVAEFECRDGAVYTAGVGGRKANALGLQDMLGNAMEWVEDCFDESHGTVPGDGSARQKCSNMARRVLRGGSWRTVPQLLRSANRNRVAPDNRSDDIGFRLARTL